MSDSIFVLEFSEFHVRVYKWEDKKKYGKIFHFKIIIIHMYSSSLLKNSWLGIPSHHLVCLYYWIFSQTVIGMTWTPSARNIWKNAYFEVALGNGLLFLWPNVFSSSSWQIFIVVPRLFFLSSTKLSCCSKAHLLLVIVILSLKALLLLLLCPRKTLSCCSEALPFFFLVNLPCCLKALLSSCYRQIWLVASDALLYSSWQICNVAWRLFFY